VNVLVLQHIACEPPGVFEDVLLERGAQIIRVELDEGEPPPSSLQRFDAVIVMGGPMSANDEREHRWLVAEKSLLRDAVQTALPVWGVCLGVQLLASALGARVAPGPASEVGILPVTPTPAGRADPVFGPCRWPLTTLQWHGETFDLPPEALLLASSPAYPHQAIRIGAFAYGVQFHVEVDPKLAADWASVPEYVAAANDALGPGGADRLLADVRSAAPRMAGQARDLFGRWIDLWAPGSRTPERRALSAARGIPAGD
jgi:GMP synthase (glutamine-hydrolysing)